MHFQILSNRRGGQYPYHTVSGALSRQSALLFRWLRFGQMLLFWNPLGNVLLTEKKKNGFPRPAPLRQKWSECTKQHTIHFDFDPVSADLKRHRTTLPTHITLQLTSGAQDYRGTLLRGHVLGAANNLPGTRQSSARAAANCKMGCSIFWRQFFALVRKNALTKRRSKLQLVRWEYGSAVLRQFVDHHCCVAVLQA